MARGQMWPWHHMTCSVEGYGRKLEVWLATELRILTIFSLTPFQVGGRGQQISRSFSLWPNIESDVFQHRRCDQPPRMLDSIWVYEARLSSLMHAMVLRTSFSLMSQLKFLSSTKTCAGPWSCHRYVGTSSFSAALEIWGLRQERKFVQNEANSLEKRPHKVMMSHLRLAFEFLFQY
jgi:hypothetical protein